MSDLMCGYKILNDNHIIHRDLKPENILINNLKFKITDFGFARYLESNSSMTEKRCTPLYGAP